MIIGVREELRHSAFQCKSRGCWAIVDIQLERKNYRLLSIYNNTSFESLKKDLEEILETRRN